MTYPPAQPEPYVTRHEHEALEHQVAALDRAVREGFAEIKGTLEKRNPGWANWLTMAGMIAVVFYYGVTASSRLEAIEAWRGAHQAFSDAKSSDFALSIGALERIAATNREALKEQEMQHVAIVTAMNLQDQRLEQLLRVHHPDIPATTYWPLHQIGEAVGATANGH